MTSNEKEFLKIMYDLTKGKKSIPFTLYFEVFLERLKLPFHTILSIYTLLLEKGLIKSERQDRIYLTEMAMVNVTVD